MSSRWLRGGHEWVGTADDEIPVQHLARFATEDLEDIDAADVLVCFTEPPRTGPARGGRHVEMGYALAKGKPIICVGHRENVFYCLPHLFFCDQWEDAFHLLTNASGAQLKTTFNIRDRVLGLFTDAYAAGLQCEITAPRTDNAPYTARIWNKKIEDLETEGDDAP